MFKSFTASFAKWRFETIDVVLEQVGNIRSFCEVHCKADLFGKVKNTTLLKDMLAACSSGWLWSWVVVVYRLVVHPLENIRRWGLVCPCCLRRDPSGGRVRAACPRASRRLHEAWQYLREEAQKLRDMARSLTLAVCERQDLMMEVRRMLVTAADLLLVKFKYLSQVPWSFACADNAEVCAQIVEEINSKPINLHEPLTQHIAANYSGDIIAVRDGGEPSDALRHEISCLRNTPLDESLGEGFHRSTHLVVREGAASKLAHIKSSIRFQQNMRRVKDVIRKNPAVGKRVVTFEWRKYKRVLQARSGYLERPVRLPDGKFFSRVYERQRAFGLVTCV